MLYAFTVRYDKGALQRAPFGHPLVRYAPSQKESLMKKRLVSVLAILSLLVIGLVASPPTARALEPVAPSFATIPVAAMNGITAFTDGSLQVSTCHRNDNILDSAMYLDTTGKVRSTLRGVGDTSGDGAQCEASNAGYGREDGTLYGTRFDTTDEKWSKLVAWKNDRELWSVDTTSPIGCYQPEMAALRAMRVSSMSEGPNGNLYMLLTPSSISATCPGRLFGVNSDTGAVVMNVPLGDWKFEGTVTGWVGSPFVWTYPNKMVVVTLDGHVREFDYNGAENSAVSYKLPLPPRRTVSDLAMNAEGTLFAAISTDHNAQVASLAYRRASDAATHEIPVTDGSMSIGGLQLTADGNAVAISRDATRLIRFDIAAETAVSTTPQSLTTGYPQNLVTSYIEDADGNSLTTFEHATWDWSKTTTSIELYNKSANTTTPVWSHEADASDLTNHPRVNTSMSGWRPRESIVNGTLFLATCVVGNNGLCSDWDGGAQIQKIDIAPFGTPLGKGYKRNGYTSQKLNYVAMGDSFSSGEGNEPFLAGSDTSTNKCHRSKYAYPILLEQDASLNLNMTAFVACSGATTSNILTSGQNGEPRQLGALSNSTKIVTLTIGGNDLGFASILRSCITALGVGNNWGCSSNAGLNSDISSRLSALNGTTSSTVLSPQGQAIHSIESVLSSIAAQAPNATIYIAGYPRLFGSDVANFTQDTSAQGGYRCNTWTSSFSYTDTQWMNQKADELNQVIAAAVTVARSQGASVAYVPPSLFSGHRHCDSNSPYIYGLLLDDIQTQKVNAGSMHPDENGQSIGYGLMFKTKLTS